MDIPTESLEVLPCPSAILRQDLPSQIILTHETLRKRYDADINYYLVLAFARQYRRFFWIIPVLSAVNIV